MGDSLVVTEMQTQIRRTSVILWERENSSLTVFIIRKMHKYKKNLKLCFYNTCIYVLKLKTFLAYNEI